MNELPETSGNKAILIYVYFGLLAVFTPIATSMGLGYLGILAAMAVAAVVLMLGKITVAVIKKKMANVSLSRRQWFEMLSGMPQQSSPRSQEVESTAQVVGEATPAPLPRETRSLAVTAQPEQDAQGRPARIIENNGLYLSDNFMPDVNTLFGQVLIAFGIRGYGKSNFLSVLCEELAPYHLPMLIVDTKDQYAPLAERTYLPRGYRAGSPDLRTDGEYIKLRTSDAYRFGKQIMENCFQVVLNMASYETKDEAALVLCELIRGMDDWAQDRPNGERIPVEVVVDEAGTWLPQEGSVSEVSKTTQHYLNRTFFGTVVNRGRSNGWGLALANQRVQGINKSVLQSPWKFLFFQTQKVDLEQYATFGLSALDVMSLGVSECYIFSPTVIGFRTFMRKQTSPSLGHTPGLEQLMGYRKQLRPIGMLTLHDGHELSVTPSVPDSEEQRVEQREKTPVVEISGLPVHSLSQEQQKVLTIFKEGTTSHREIATLTDISESKAYRILEQLDAAGFIQRRKLQVQ